MLEWKYQNKVLEEVPTGIIAFVYLIENETNGMLYVGKKTMFSTTRKPPLKGFKRKRVVTVESNWRAYTGSSQALNTDIEAGHLIKRTILHLCKSKGAATYLELMEQVNREVLFDESYYNRFVGCKIHASHVQELQNEKTVDQRGR
ncbi:hypothetical protein EOK75_17295 (plasmid) [Pseudorhodobacter turbinis]|uniref:Putative endonuclease SegE-like GIY-YIG domain-containing protein n=1 Tax=Pseudorhodobacter turbinis TaxID=2500533 RepID=A0A4P8EKD4_9RHOB|nr:hypothetical protein [Pseudorhodobacter turbinis]QCO57469.1 hypothetical protein EOK75_17295 [Pseudorhodobacter turbinis]